MLEHKFHKEEANNVTAVCVANGIPFEASVEGGVHTLLIDREYMRFIRRSLGRKLKRAAKVQRLTFHKKKVAPPAPEPADDPPSD